jgi:hypothetical protein
MVQADAHGWTLTECRRRHKTYPFAALCTDALGRRQLAPFRLPCDIISSGMPHPPYPSG